MGVPYVATKDPNGFDCIIREDRDYKQISVLNKNASEFIPALAINFSRIFPDFRKYAKLTGYEGDLLDKESYNRLFDECSYVIDKSYPVKFKRNTVRSLCIDIRKARDAGINLEGFGLAA